MSNYSLNKMIREVNRNPSQREKYLADPAAFVAGFGLDAAEQEAFLARDIRKLYALGVHGLILRPFTIIMGMSEPDYLKAIRGAECQ